MMELLVYENLAHLGARSRWGKRLKNLPETLRLRGEESLPAGGERLTESLYKIPFSVTADVSRLFALDLNRLRADSRPLLPFCRGFLRF
jgi:hypothetical protein